METVFLYSLLLIIVQVKCGFLQKNARLSDCNVFPLSVNLCKTDNVANFTFILKTIDDDGDKAVDITLDLKEAVDSSFKIFIEVDMYSFGLWQNVITRTVDMCYFIPNYLAKIWKKITEEVNPPIIQDCGIDSGYYEIHDFQAQSTDLEIPVSLYGKFRVEVKGLYSDGRVVICFVSELEIDAV